MKSIGIVRKVDQLGRVVIPMELRKSMNIRRRTTIRTVHRRRNDNS